MFIKDNKPFDINVPHIIEDVQYPAGYFLSAEARDEHGITEVADPVPADPRFYFNTQNEDGSISSTAKPLDMVRATLWDQIKTYRDTRKMQGYLVGTKWFHSDPDSRTQQLGLVLLGSNIPSGLQWKTMDGSFIEMTQTLAGQILAAAAASDTAMFAEAEYHNAAFEAMTTMEDIIAHDWKAGWPQVYADTLS